MLNNNTSITMKLLEVLKRVFSAAIVMTASLAQFTSCDSREDWFAKEGEEATFIIKSFKFPYTSASVNEIEESDKYEFRSDTFSTDKKGVIEYNLTLDHYHDVKDLGFYHFSEKLYLDIVGISRKTEKSCRFTSRDYSAQVTYIIPELVEEGQSFAFCGVTTKSQEFASDTTAALVNCVNIFARIKDVFGNPYDCHIKINFWGDIPPIPVVEIKDVDGKPMEKIISLKNSYDKDGSIVKYEYCIDGNVVSYEHGTFEERESSPAHSGKGAYGGTYITATDESEVKHAFQTEGAHEVYYRCLDDKGVWCSWKKEIVTVE